GEVWAKVPGLPGGMVFPRARADDMAYVGAHPALLDVFQQFGGLPRQPTELYEAVLEGLCLLAFLWWFSSKPRPRMAISGLFLLGYGVVRFAVEFIRLPDPQFGYLLWGWVTMGQLLCVPMLVGGAIIFYLAHHKRGAAA
ncbi:MAG: prolipoprotein diacylglyceryl transferase, partial [Sinobacteraceae bacterium]|nr:prolipoprotein diacylglyceryl transferase [Nevskiaceae bacterium]